MVGKGFLGMFIFACAMAAVIGLPVAHGVLSVDWYSIDAGGGTTTSGTLTLHGTIGQPDAHTVSSGTYVLTGGFRAVSHCAVSDVNEDGSVDVVDLLYLVETFGTARGDAGYSPACDFNADGSVDVIDLLLLVDYFGT